jgi:hypothetical protein
VLLFIVLHDSMVLLNHAIRLSVLRSLKCGGSINPFQTFPAFANIGSSISIKKMKNISLYFFNKIILFLIGRH